jgi:hypothetical protein
MLANGRCLGTLRARRYWGPIDAAEDRSAGVARLLSPSAHLNAASPASMVEFRRFVSTWGRYASTHTQAFGRELMSIVLHIDDELTRRGRPERVAIGLTVDCRGSAGG